MATYTDAPLVIGWLGVHFPTGVLQNWNSPDLSHPIPFSIPHGNPVQFVAGVSGANSLGQFYGITTAGSTSITSVTSVTSLAVGQLLCDGLGIPPNSRIASISGSTVVFGNGMFNEDANAFLNSQGATESVGGQWFATFEDFPLGSLAVTVSPMTGINVADDNPDGTGSIEHVGAGTAIGNEAFEPEGAFYVTFDSAGTFTVTATFIPVAGDSNFSTATTPAIVVTVT
jgi:hypothetical protein